MNIGPMQAGDVDEVVELHMCHLTTRLVGKPGRALLRRYYSYLIDSPFGFCLVCHQDPDPAVLGVVVLRWDAQRVFWELFKQAPVQVSILFAWHVLCRPASLYRFFRLMWERRPAKELLANLTGHPRWCLLHALVVRDPGGGVGTRLVQMLLQEARNRGFQYIITSTFEGNAANHVYEKVGFSLLMVTAEGQQRVNWYGLPLT